ncbi:MAG: hypothetical protein FJ304_20125 [Planctomycetes bacterium]|nr:hypothetical protein [Planctomycetota bacterium]
MLEVCEDRTTPTPVVTAAALSDAPEGSSGYRWRLTRDDTSSSLTVNLSFSGTADSGDFTNPMFASFMTGQATADVYLSTNDDSTSEPTETLILTVASGTGYTVGTPASATVNIFDNDAQVIWESAGEIELRNVALWNVTGGSVLVKATAGHIVADTRPNPPQRSGDVTVSNGAHWSAEGGATPHRIEVPFTNNSGEVWLGGFTFQNDYTHTSGTSRLGNATVSIGGKIGCHGGHV